LNRPELRVAGTLTLAALLFCSFIASAESTDSGSRTPLFDYAIGQPVAPAPNDHFVRKQIATFEAEMSRHPPPSDSECAHTLGASRFAAQYDDLGTAQSNAGNYDAAIEAYEKALACAPRAADIHAELATELFHAGRLSDARTTAARGVALSENSSDFDSVLMQLDFIEEHWAEAVSRLRAMATAETDPQRATYYQCFLWLAQRRAGVKHPELVSRDEYEEWPAQILATLKGTMTEAELLDEIRAQKNEVSRREELVEALYYIGQSRLATGETETARRYFAAGVNLKVLYFIEHHLALAEIIKMRSRSAAAPEGLPQG
jgi:lipoprotein NlpI